MLLRIALIVAILAGLGAAAISHTKVAGNIATLTTERDQNATDRDQARSEATANKKKADESKKELDKTSKELAATTANLETVTAEAKQQRTRANDMMTKLETTTRERNESQAELAAWRATGLTSDQVSNVVYTLKKTVSERDAFVDENGVLLRDNRQLQARVDKYELKGERKVVLPTGLKGKVVAVDPKWEFIVVDIGTDQGALEDGEMLVNRGGKLVAKVRLTSVQRNRCIANILPEWKQAEVKEGDQVVY